MPQGTFVKYAMALRDRFKPDPYLELKPVDLYHMAQNQVVLEPLGPHKSQFYSSVLRCLLCGPRYTDLESMIAHCHSIDHRRLMYKSQLVSDAIEPTREEHPVTPTQSSVCAKVGTADHNFESGFPDRYVLACMKNRTEGIRRCELENIILTAPPVAEYICELCQICVRDMDRFLLHLSGYGHTARLERLDQLGLEYYQAFLDHDSGEITYLRFPDSRFVEQIPLDDRQTWYGYANISEVSIIKTEQVRQYIEETS
jgi:hypothetical protein